MNWHKLIWIAFAIAFAALQVALIAAKLTGAVAASWWLVLTPLWLPVACVAVIAALGIAFLSNAQANGENPFQ